MKQGWVDHSVAPWDYHCTAISHGRQLPGQRGLSLAEAEGGRARCPGVHMSPAHICWGSACREAGPRGVPQAHPSWLPSIRSALGSSPRGARPCGGPRAQLIPPSVRAHTRLIQRNP